METNSTVIITKYRELADGDIFQANSSQNGAHFLGMKVATRKTKDDQPSRDVLVFYQDRPPAIFNEGYVGNSGVVGKFRNLAFSVHPRKPADIIFDLRSDIRARAGAGCVYMIGDDIFLGAVWRQQGADAENTCFVNMRTGECWHDDTIGTSRMPGNPGLAEINLLRGGAAVVPCWQIVETTTQDGTPRIAYEVPGGLRDTAA